MLGSVLEEEMVRRPPPRILAGDSALIVVTIQVGTEASTDPVRSIQALPLLTDLPWPLEIGTHSLESLPEPIWPVLLPDRFKDEPIPLATDGDLFDSCRKAKLFGQTNGLTGATSQNFCRHDDILPFLV